MPKTPPLILPNGIPNDWVNRSRINKSGSKVKNIFAAQTKKQLRFDETEELQFPDSYDPPSTDIDFHLQNEKSNPPSSPQTASDVFYFTPLNQQQQQQQNTIPSQTSSHKLSQDHTKNNLSQRSFIQTENTTEDGKMDIDKPNQTQEKQQMALQNSENFDSILVDMTSEFQQFMEEHKRIKQSIEDKRRELEQFTTERMNYLDKRQAYLEDRMGSLKEFY